MKVIDTHCDALLKLQTDYRAGMRFGGAGEGLNYLSSEELDTNLQNLKSGQVKTQFFAIFIPPQLPDNEKWQHALEQVDLFYTEVLAQDNVVHIKHLSEIKELKEHQIGAVLTLEGSDAFGNDLIKLRTLIRLGVLSLGLVWNNANLVADGVGENRDAGLTNFGLEVIEECNANDVLIDVSHLNVTGFYDIIDKADRVFASHSNSRALFDHPRNLYDDQVKAIFEKGGMVNVVFMPGFIGDGDIVIADLIEHIEHLIKLGGDNHIGIGSDFDGISTFVENLENAGKHQNLIQAIQDKFGTEIAEKISHKNFIDRFC
jgi:membrane dipeptidase